MLAQVVIIITTLSSLSSIAIIMFLLSLLSWYACRRAWSALSVESANNELKQGLELSKKLQQGILK
jgi:hypothetical protein